MKSIEDLINGMKAQTFGVEVEGNNITRQQAAKTAAVFFGTNRYANTAATNGYFTWSAWDQQGREWKNWGPSPPCLPFCGWQEPLGVSL